MTRRHLLLAALRARPGCGRWPLATPAIAKDGERWRWRRSGRGVAGDSDGGGGGDNSGRGGGDGGGRGGDNSGRGGGDRGDDGGGGAGAETTAEDAGAAATTAGRVGGEVGAAMTVAGRGGWGSTSSEQARDAVSQGWAFSLSTVLPTVSKAVPGQVLEVDLHQSWTGEWHYEFLVLTRDRRYQEVVVDARRNQILRIRRR